MHPTIAAVLAERGVIAARDFPSLSPAMRRLVGRGELANPLPGVFVDATDSSQLTRLRAVSAWSAPQGTLRGTSAASPWMPSLSGPVMQLAHPALRSRPGVAVIRRQVPGEFVRDLNGVRVVSPAYAAAELAAQDDGRAACEALRLRLATHEELLEATRALAGSRGNAERSVAIAACAGNPWSYAELRLHRILRTAGLGGWVANRPLRLGGVLLHPDVRFRAARVVVEFDGRATHGEPAQFRTDRESQNAYVAAGFLVVRFTWEHLDDPEYVVRVVRDVLRLRGY